MPDGAQWLGALPHDEVLPLFRSARAVIVPSMWADPCPTVVLEAMAAGRPVVASASGGILDMVVDGVTGRLVPPGDVSALAQAISSVLRDPQGRPGVRRRRTRPGTGIHRQRRCRTHRAPVRQRHRGNQGRGDSCWLSCSPVRACRRRVWQAAQDRVDGLSELERCLPRCGTVLVRPSRLLGVFASLVGSQLGGAVLGLVFWTLAARALTPEQVGVGAALVAAMTLLSTFGVLGIGTLLLERFKVVSVTDRRALLSTGLGIAGMGGALVAAGWLGLSALVHLSGVLGDLSLSSALLLVGTTGIAATCSAFDQAVIGMGVSSVQLRRNLLASILRIAVLSGAIGLDVRSGQVYPCFLDSRPRRLSSCHSAAATSPTSCSGDHRATLALGAKPLGRGDGPPRSHIGSGIE